MMTIEKKTNNKQKKTSIQQQVFYIAVHALDIVIERKHENTWGNKQYLFTGHVALMVIFGLNERC